MKRLLAIIFSMAIILGILSGCSSQNDNATSDESLHESVESFDEQSGDVSQKDELSDVSDEQGGDVSQNDESSDISDEQSGDVSQDDESSDISDEQSGDEQSEDSSDYPPETERTLLKEKDGEYILTLPKSNCEIKLNKSYVRFEPYIVDELVIAAETNLLEDVSEYTNHSEFYFQVNEDYLCLTLEVIKYLDEPDPSVGCFDHKHIFFSERISTIAIKEETSEIGTSDPDYYKIQFFNQSLLEFSEVYYDESEFTSDLISNNDMELLTEFYENGKGWHNDSVVDREPFFFDGRIRFITEDSFGWMFFGFEQNILYYNGLYRELDEKIKDMIIVYQKSDASDNNTLESYRNNKEGD